MTPSPREKSSDAPAGERRGELLPPISQPVFLAADRAGRTESASQRLDPPNPYRPREAGGAFRVPDELGVPPHPGAERRRGVRAALHGRFADAQLAQRVAQVLGFRRDALDRAGGSVRVRVRAARVG